jgi:hypothetical protein
MEKSVDVICMGGVWGLVVGWIRGFEDWRIGRIDGWISDE